VIVTPAPVVVATPDWSGLYIGGQLGYGRLAVSEDGDEEGEFDDTYSGPIFGAHAGFQQDFGRLVAGVEGSYARTGISEEDIFAGEDLGGLAEEFGLDPDDIADEFGGFDANVDSIARLGARLGFDAGRLMPYATAGISRTNLSTDGLGDALADAAPGVPEAAELRGEELEGTVDGRFFGAGVEYMMSDRFMIGAEVIRHSLDLEDAEFEALDMDLGGIEGVDSNITTIALRGSFKF
jgi:opacity protein-like surface antigen